MLSRSNIASFIFNRNYKKNEKQSRVPLAIVVLHYILHEAKPEMR